MLVLARQLLFLVQVYLRRKGGKSSARINCHGSVELVSPNAVFMQWIKLKPKR